MEGPAKAHYEKLEMHENLNIEENLKGASVLVTGSSGMLGQAIIPLLHKAGAQVLSVDLRPCRGLLNTDEHLEVSITDREQLLKFARKHQPSHVINLAAECGTGAPTDLEDYLTNRTGVEVMCDLVAELDSVERWIHTSSQTVCRVGFQPETDEEFCPESVYGESKVLGEKLVRSCDGGGKPWTIVRPTTVWGPGINLDYLTSHFIYHIHRGNYFHVGGGALNKSYSFVGNIAYQYWRILTLPAEEVHRKMLYLADYEVLSIRDMANELAQTMKVRKPFTMPLPLAHVLAKCGDVVCLTGKNFPFQSKRLANMRLEYVYDMSATEAVCGPLPYSFHDGVELFADWYLKEIEGQG